MCLSHDMSSIGGDEGIVGLGVDGRSGDVFVGNVL